MSERRGHPRARPQLPVVCEIHLGPVSFEAMVVDLSLGGIGTLVYDAAVRLDPGQRLPGARIRHPQREPVTVDMEVRHVARIVLADGRPANRAGCRLFGPPGDIEDLVRRFLAELGE
jgi:hypothetical protein